MISRRSVSLFSSLALVLAFMLLSVAQATDNRHTPTLTLQEYLKLDRTGLHRCKPPTGKVALEARDIVALKLSHYVKPPWPVSGHGVHEEGYLVYELLISKNGDPYCYELLETNLQHWEFQETVETTFRKWHFEPPTNREGKNASCYAYALVKY